MIKLNNNTEKIEFLFHDELTEEFTINSNAFIMIHCLKNFRRFSEFSKYITFQKKIHPTSTISNNANIINLVLKLKQKSEYIIIQIPLTDFDSYEKLNSS